VPLTGGGTKTTGVVRCDQPRTLDLAARGGSKLESIPDAVMDEVLARISPILSEPLSEPRLNDFRFLVPSATLGATLLLSAP